MRERMRLPTKKEEERILREDAEREREGMRRLIAQRIETESAWAVRCAMYGNRV